jgi:O-antigen ligase
MALLVGLALDPGRWYSRADVAVCAAGLVATQSRGAVLAFAVGILFVPWATVRSWLWPLLAGVAGGLIVVGTSSGPATQPRAAAALCAVLVVGGVVRLPIRMPVVTPRRALLLAGAAAVVVAVVVAALHTPIERRIELNSTGDRVTEWTAAYDQWRSAPWLGVGPDTLLRFHAVDGTYAHFAHNEYLQVLADAGVVGELLLLASTGTVIAAVRRRDVLSSCATGALAAFAVAGALDFDWHLAALGLVGGWAAGLAGSPRTGPAVEGPQAAGSG